MRADVEPRLPVGHDALAGGEAFGGDRRVVIDGLRTDRTLLHRVVGFDHPDIEAVRAALHRDRRNGHGVLVGRDQDADADELARPQPLVLVGKFRLQPDRAGGLIDLIVDQQQMALGELILVVLIEGENRDAAAQHRLAHRAEGALRQRENHVARFYLGQHRERIDIGGVDDVADVDLAKADDAVDRCYDRRIGELSLRRLDGALVGVDRGLEMIDLGLLQIDVLLRIEILGLQGGEARKILLRIDQLRLIVRFLGDGLIEDGFERRRIDPRQHVALAHLLALAEVDGNQLAGDLGADGDGVVGRHGAERVVIDRDVVLGRFGDRDRHHRRAGDRGGFAVPPDHDRGNHGQRREADQRKNDQPAGPVTGFQRSRPINSILRATWIKPGMHLRFHYLTCQ